ncbi:hypothetical protein [Curtobacterium sp. VKM Ac-1395]|uniref:hypothetical protein n=1 Tax=Curtobacterium sp. VKM Ac-1395 TaxID=2783815 RepID=UPI00188B7F38|nr:hypothetical protein [Curtobacterium sp. VKM Ac-1395]MBF4592021.1 hypothetical protein [Curtobacterium sp. VKM Ac-1395]
MFGRKRRAQADGAAATTGDGAGQDTELDRWLAQADAEATTNPLAYATLMGRRLAALTTTSFTDGADLDPQSAVTVLGAMTGLGTQAALVMGKRSGDPDYTSRTDLVIDGANGARALMGDAIAFPLFDAQYSVWNIVTTPLRSVGGTAPSAEDLTVRAAQAIGTDAFVVPRLEPGTSVRWLPREALEHCGRALAIQHSRRLPVTQWYVAYALAVKTILDQYRAEPAVLASLTRVALDSANAMAKYMPPREGTEPQAAAPDGAAASPSAATTPPMTIADDRFARARAVGDGILAHAAAVFEDPQGLHAETVLTVLGSLAGRAAQVAALRGVENASPEYQGRVNRMGQGPDGERFAVGDATEYPLFVAPASVYAIVTAPLVDAGRIAPTAEDIRHHSSVTMGTPEFDVPRFAPGTSARWMPREAVGFGLRTFAIPAGELPPEDWYVAYAHAAAKLLEMNRGHLDIEPLTRVVLDAANIAAALLVTPTEDPPAESPRR